MTVVDASVVVELALSTPASGQIGRWLRTGAGTLHAPHLLDLEVAHAVRRMCLSGEVTTERGARALEILAGMALLRHPHGPLLSRIWELRHNLTAYDAAYVALAEALGAMLVTRDRRLARSRGHAAKVELV